MDNGNLIITKSRDTFNPSKDDDDFNISVNIKNNAAGDKYKFVVKNGGSKGEITSLPKNLGTITTKKSSNEITFEDDFKVGDSETISQNIAIDHLKDSTSINQMVDGGESPITLSLLKSRRYDTY